ncbi:AraC family transcriptional regulator ligand-binding domain-containing protein [Pseudoalteromonas sp. SSDWG2]|uniref:AraC family transcriptional regulator n=1 Tax=Pseudoalteromonas sp. SSDWG2 TaxID=3139391 RepID=UPI003BACD891
MQDYLRMGALDGFSELIEQLGEEPFSLMQKVNILPGQSSDPDLMVPYASVGKLLELSSQQLNEPCLGARISRVQGLSTIGIVGAYMAQQPTIESALQCGQKFADMHAQGAVLSLTKYDDELSELMLDIRVNDTQQYPQLVQMSLGLLNCMIGEMIGDRWHAQRICLRQSLSASVVERLTSIYGCEVKANSAHDSLIFSQKSLSLVPRQPENLLNHIIEKQFKQARATDVDHKRLVRHAINVLLPTGDCSKENIAASLGMHPKKLERLLAESGSTYRQLLEQTRKEIAMHTLSGRNMPMITLALNLGYADFSAFSRSFKRWTGMPPSQYVKLQNEQ